MYVFVCSLYLYMHIRRSFTKSGHEPFKKQLGILTNSHSKFQAV